MASEQGLSAENRRLVQLITPMIDTEWETIPILHSELNALLNAARSIPPVDEGVREKVAADIADIENLLIDAEQKWNDPHTFASAKEAWSRILALPASPPSGWRTMDSAPKGSGLEVEFVTDADYVQPPRILLQFANGMVSTAYWDWYYAAGGAGYEGGLSWIEPISGERLDLHYDAPVGWQPLPPPPVSGRAEP